MASSWCFPSVSEGTALHAASVSIGNFTISNSL